MADYKFKDIGEDFIIQVDNGPVTTHSGNSQAAATAIGSIVRVQTFYPYFEVYIDKTVHNIFINDVNVTANSVSSIVASLNEDVFVSSGTAVGGGGASITDITYSALVTAIGASTLTPGQMYKITDYATVHYIFDINLVQYEINTGDVEPIIVTAINEHQLSSIAASTVFPQDIIHYDPLPDNWLDDFAFTDFSGAPSIIPGFKGVILFRHDTILDNSCGFDFRNCKSRRWKTDVPDYVAGTTYAQGDFVTYSGFIYKSLKSSNTGNQPNISTNFWVSVLDLSKTEYYCNNPTSTNGILAGTVFEDFKTFAEGVNSATYELGVRSTHFRAFKDSGTYDDGNASILTNNVVFLQDNSIYSCMCNIVCAESRCNTIIGDFFEQNNIGSYFNNNILGGWFSGNDVGVGLQNNIISNQCRGNTLQTQVTQNCIGAYFQYNNVGSFFTDNIIGDNCQSNTFLSQGRYNSIGQQLNGNEIGTNFQNNIVGSSVNSNVFGSGFQQNTIGPTFKNNNVSSGFNLGGIGIDLTGATHVYESYSCTLFSRQDGGKRLSYYDNSNAQVIVNANA